MTQPPGYGPPPEQPATPAPQPGPAQPIPPGYFPPPGNVPPPPGHFSPPPGHFPPQPGSFPPPGQFPPQPGNFPPPGQFPPQPGYFSPPGQFPPQPGNFPPPPGYFLAPPVPVSPAGVPLADFGTRLGAYVIDGLLLGAVNLAFVLPAFFLFISHIAATAPDTGSDDDPGQFFATAVLPLFALEAGAFVFGIALSYLYSVEVMHRSGQTLGKRILKIRVVPLDPNLRLTRSMAVKRWATEYLPSVFVPFYGLIDGLWQLWDRPFQQTLHDKAAQTIVVKVSA